MRYQSDKRWIGERLKDYFCHAYVMRFTRNGIYNLKRESQANEGAGEFGQETVVVAFASAEAVTRRSECHAGNDGEVYLMIVGEKLSF